MTPSRERAVGSLYCHQGLQTGLRSLAAEVEDA